MPPEAAPTPGTDDGLEPSRVRTAPAGLLAAGLLLFLAVTLVLLGAYFRALVPGPASPPPRPFPAPQLETSVDPRSLPPELPGPVPAPRPAVAPPLDEALLKRAMAAVVARGQRAYDPPPAPEGRP